MIDRRNTEACFMPKPATPEEADLYREIHRIHCDRRDEAGHECKGALTIRARSVTLSCPLCGDARKVLP